MAPYEIAQQRVVTTSFFLSFISQKSNGMGASKIKDQCATRAISSAFETRNIISYRESSCHERWMKKKF